MSRLQLKYVHQYRDRHGKLRHYFRRTGARAMPLPGLVGSEEFMLAYQAALGTVVPKPEIGADRTIPGTINALVVSYYRSEDWSNLTLGTKKNRKPLIERFREQHGNKGVATLQTDHVLKMLADIPKLTTKRNWLKAIRGLLRSAIPTMRKDDPTAGIAIKLPKTKGHHSWTDAEIEQYRTYWPLGTQQRLVMEFALETASRRTEVLRLGPQAYQERPNPD